MVQSLCAFYENEPGDTEIQQKSGVLLYVVLYANGVLEQTQSTS